MPSCSLQLDFSEAPFQGSFFVVPVKGPYLTTADHLLHYSAYGTPPNPKTQELEEDKAHAALTSLWQL